MPTENRTRPRGGFFISHTKLDTNLPELYSEHSDGDKRRPLLLDVLRHGVTTDVGDTELRFNKRKAEIATQVGDAAISFAVNRAKEASATARMSILGGNLEVGANRSSDGNRRYSLQFRKQF